MVERHLEGQNQPDASSAQTATAAALHADAYSNKPGLLARTWNVTKSIASGAADRLSDDVVHFGEHPWRSSAEIVGTTVAAGAAIAGSVEVGAAVATYAGVATLSTEMGALFGAGTAAGIMGPGADALAARTASDWKATADARSVVADPITHTPEQIAAAQQQIGQTLGQDALANTALYGGLVAGVVGAEFAPRMVPSFKQTAETSLATDTSAAKPLAQPEVANDNIPSGIRRDAGGNLSGSDAGKLGFNVFHDSKTGEPSLVSFRDGDNSLGFAHRKGDKSDQWYDPRNPNDKATVTVDNKTGVRVIHDGDEFKFGTDGTSTVERYNGYKEVADTRYPGAAGIRSLKIPNNGPEITQETLPGGQSQLTMTQNGRTFVSEPGNAESGWTFKGKDGQSGPGFNGADAVVKLTNEDPAPADYKRGWGVSVTNIDGGGSRLYGKNGWQKSEYKDGNSTTTQLTDSSDRVHEAETKNGDMNSRLLAYDFRGLPVMFETHEVPGAKVTRGARSPLTLTEGGVDTLVSNFRELRDPTAAGWSGFSVDMPDGTTRQFWSNGK